MCAKDQIFLYLYVSYVSIFPAILKQSAYFNWLMSNMKNNYSLF